MGCAMSPAPAVPLAVLLPPARWLQGAPGGGGTQQVPRRGWPALRPQARSDAWLRVTSVCAWPWRVAQLPPPLLLLTSPGRATCHRPHKYKPRALEPLKRSSLFPGQLRSALPAHQLTLQHPGCAWSFPAPFSLGSSGPHIRHWAEQRRSSRGWPLVVLQPGGPSRVLGGGTGLGRAWQWVAPSAPFPALQISYL